MWMHSIPFLQVSNSPANMATMFATMVELCDLIVEYHFSRMSK